MKTKSTESLSVKAGSVLLSEKPFVCVLKSSLLKERCNYCFKRLKLFRCSVCHYVHYCGRDCQKLAWTEHKQECGKLKRIQPRIVPDAALLMARVILKLKKGGDQEKSFYTKTKFRKFKDLMSHYSDLKQDCKRMEHFTSLYGVLVEFLGEGELPNSAELMGIYGRMCVNGFNILDPEMLSLGTGLYLGISVLNHSCDPNAVAVFEGTTIYIRALKDMPCLDWDKTFISYIELMNTPETRQTELQAAYYFLCDCSRCKDIDELRQMHAMRCPRNECGQAIPLLKNEISTNGIELKCSSCNEHIKPERIKEYLEVLDFTQHHLQSMKDIAYIDVCKVCLKKQEGLFHPLNLFHVKVMDLAFESSIELGQWEEAKQIGPELIKGYRKYYTDRHPMLGILYMKLGKIELFLGNPKIAMEYLHNAQQVLLITHGRDHSLYRNELRDLLQQATS